VPHLAEAKLSCRLVPDQTPARVFRLIRHFVRQHCRDAEVIHEASLSPYLVDPSGPHLEAAQQAMFEAFGRRPALTREGGSIGAVVTMDRVLRAPVVLLACPCPSTATTPSTRTSTGVRRAGAWRCSAATSTSWQISLDVLDCGLPARSILRHFGDRHREGHVAVEIQ